MVFARFTAKLETPCNAYAQCNISNQKFWFCKKRLQPIGLTYVVSHDCLSFPLIDCNSATGLAVVSARNRYIGFVDASLLASMKTCPQPAMPNRTIHNRNPFTFFHITLRPAGLTCIESRDCLLFPQLGCNSGNEPAAVSAINN